MISQKAKALRFFLKNLNLKEKIDFMQPKRSQKPQVPRVPESVGKSTELWVHNRVALTISPVHIGLTDHVVYFHGGGYALEGSQGHFQLIKKIIKSSNMTVTYVDYPLAPESDAEETLAMSIKVYEALLESYPYHHFILMGDSAGGGLALSLAMLIRDKGLKGPFKIVLFSPWLDIGLSNPHVKVFEDRDHLLSLKSLQEIGEIYRGKLASNHYLVSPKYGNLKGLGDIAVFFGTEEILYPDCLEFCEDHSKDETKVKAYVYEGMPHDWVLFPVPESENALKEAVAFIQERF
jgi:acetyl esterase/lipase